MYDQVTLTCMIGWHRVWSGDINVYDQAQCASQCSCIEDLWVSVQCLIKSPRWRYFLQPLLRTRVSVTGRTDLALIIKRWLDFAMHLSVKEFDGFVDTCRLCTCLQNPTVNTQYLHILRTWSVQMISNLPYELWWFFLRSSDRASLMYSSKTNKTQHHTMIFIVINIIVWRCVSLVLLE